MTVRVLNVWWDGRIVGLFTQDRHGDIGFAYAGAWFDDEKALPRRLPPSQSVRNGFPVKNADHFSAACCPRKDSARR